MDETSPFYFSYRLLAVSLNSNSVGRQPIIIKLSGRMQKIGMQFPFLGVGK
jgi:hypothetical protein